MIWRPAPSTGIAGGKVIDDPVGHIDLAPTFSAIAGLPSPGWVEGHALPIDSAPDRDAMLCQWDADKGGLEIKMRSIYDRSGFVCTSYLKTNYYSGNEGELYHLAEDPLQWTNLWDDPAYRVVKESLVEKISRRQRPERQPALVRGSRT
jgi:arylsulfatase A-like enzyme